MQKRNALARIERDDQENSNQKPPRAPLTPIKLSLKALKPSLRSNGQFDLVLTRMDQGQQASSVENMNVFILHSYCFTPMS